MSNFVKYRIPAIVVKNRDEAAADKRQRIVDSVLVNRTLPADEKANVFESVLAKKLNDEERTGAIDEQLTSLPVPAEDKESKQSSAAQPPEEDSKKKKKSKKKESSKKDTQAKEKKKKSTTSVKIARQVPSYMAPLKRNVRSERALNAIKPAPFRGDEPIPPFQVGRGRLLVKRWV